MLTLLLYSNYILMKKIVLLFIAVACAFSCTDMFFGTTYSLEGKWGMVSGGIKRSGSFTSIEKMEEGYYKTIEFSADGTFKEVCGDAVATGTYKMRGSQSITYKYDSVPDKGSVYFAVHSSGTWTYSFWSEDSFTLYDFADSPSFEVSMTFVML